MRKILHYRGKSAHGVPLEAKVYRDGEWAEYRVKFYKHDLYQTEADHHTNDLEDAMSTAEWYVGKAK